MKVTSIVCGVLLLLVGHVYAAEAPKLERLDLPLKLTNGETTTLRELTRKEPGIRKVLGDLVSTVYGANGSL